MRFRVLAADYDRTLAEDGRIAPETLAALARLRASGRRVVLVTGRRFDDLLAVCHELDAFDLVVAENGAVLYEPEARTVRDLAPPPAPTFLAALEEAHVPYERGRVVVATVVPHDHAVGTVIATLALPLEVIFNRESVMILPRGVSKGTGLEAALARLGETADHAIAVGDAENDNVFLRRAAVGVAVANALPGLAAIADHVTTAPNGAGVCELIEGLLRDDLAAVRPRPR